MHTEKNVKIVIRKNQEDVIADRLTTIESVEQQKTKKRKVPSQKKTKNPREADKTSTTPNSQSNGMSACGGCGNNVGPVHKCDICKRNMHVWCGRTIGQEGHGAPVRCPKCDRKTTKP